MSQKELSILLVEDNLLHIELIRRALEDSPNLELTVCETITDAQQSIQDCAPDLIITDLKLPDGKGTDLISFSQNNHLSYPFILMTSFGDENIAVEAIKAGALDYIVKSAEVFIGLPKTIHRVMREWQHIVAKKLSEKHLQESEQRLADAQHMAHIGNWELNLFSQKMQCSKEIHCIFETKDTEFSVSYEVFLELIHPDDREKVNTAFKQSIKNRTPYNSVHRLLMGDGRIKYVQERSTTFYNDAGKPVSVSGTVQDITEQMNIQAQLRQSQKMEALGKLTGGIAHDFNNMLSIIIGNTDLLKIKLEHQPEYSKYLHSITYAADHSIQLITRLLDFSHIKPIDSDNVDINSKLNDILDMLEKTLTSGIQINFDLDSHLNLARVDGSDLEDCIINISINAMHAMESEGTLSIQTKNLTIDQAEALRLNIASGEFVVLNISDTGCGMNEETKSKIFDPFYSTKGNMGSGLGLSQVYGFMERSKGHIKVHSELDKGSCFSLYFPTAKSSQKKVIPAPESAMKSNYSGNEAILLVDDYKALAEMTYEILSSNGYQVSMALSAKQALELLKNEHFDLMLSDIIMPEMNGFQLAKQVQHLYPQVKIQLASGYTTVQLNGIIDDDLFNRILYKPYTSTKLLATVRGLFSQSTKRS